jgi:hypothetical protein
MVEAEAAGFLLAVEEGTQKMTFAVVGVGGLREVHRMEEVEAVLEGHSMMG